MSDFLTKPAAGDGVRALGLVHTDARLIRAFERLGTVLLRADARDLKNGSQLIDPSANKSHGVSLPPVRAAVCDGCVYGHEDIRAVSPSQS
jgi:hypothetical protein